MRTGLAIGALLILLSPEAGVPNHLRQDAGDDRAVRRIVEDAYVSGVFIARDPVAVRRGFHHDFVLSVQRDDGLVVVTLDEWLARLKLDGARSPDAVEHVFERVDVTGRTAMVKLRLIINGRHLYTDYMGLYRFRDGWKVVNKVYEDHDPG